MMRTLSARTFIQDSRGGVAVEFVALFPVFLLLTFFILDVAIAMLFVGTVEKAAQLGARLASVSDYAVTALKSGETNGVRSGHIPGENCMLDTNSDDGNSDPCMPFGPELCVGGSDGCASGFDVIFTRMNRLAGLLEPENVSVTYEYAGLGFAGGPIVPRVTVTVQDVPYNTVTSDLLAGFYRLVTGDPDADFPGLTTMPRIEATFTGEDLSSVGAS